MTTEAPPLDTRAIFKQNVKRVKERQTNGALWRCSCGYEGKYQSVVAHRHGAKLRPQCSGGIAEVPGTALVPPIDPDTPARESEPSSDTAVNTVVDGIDIITDAPEAPPPDTSDADSFARYLLEQRGISTDTSQVPFDTYEPLPPNGSGLAPPTNGRSGGFGSMPPGHYSFKPPPDSPVVSENRVSVTLPVIYHVWYDWFRNEGGWGENDGSFAAWVEDCLHHLIYDVMRLGFTVYKRSDVPNVEEEEPNG